MSNTQAGSALGALPYSYNWPGFGDHSRHSTASQADSSVGSANATPSNPYAAQSTSAVNANSSPVSLSDAARALSANAGNAVSGDGGADDAGSTAAAGSSDALTPGSSDFDQEASFLGNLANAGLAALGIISPDQESGTQISFSSLSYNVSESAAAGTVQQGGQSVAAYGSSEEADFVGQGQITTASGQTYDFEIEVDMSQSQEAAAASSDAGGGNSTDSAQAANSPTNIPLSLPSITGNPPTGGASSDASSGASSNGVSSADSSADLINWNAILDQSKGLFDLLQSIGVANQDAQASSAVGTASSAQSAGASSSSGSAQSTVASAASGDATTTSTTTPTTLTA